jgi:hypothetical protein
MGEIECLSLRPNPINWRYQSSDAVVAHVKHVISEFGKELGQVQKGLQLVVHGSPDAQAKQVLAELNPVYETPIEGFIR